MDSEEQTIISYRDGSTGEIIALDGVADDDTQSGKEQQGQHGIPQEIWFTSISG